MNVPIDRDELIEYGKAIARIEAIERIIKNTEYSNDAVYAIKCVLDMIKEEKE